MDAENEVHVDVDVDVNTTTPDESHPKLRSHGVYVSVLDPYMMGSTDYAEAMEVVDQVVCDKE